jgi:hypothetical protein
MVGVVTPLIINSEKSKELFDKYKLAVVGFIWSTWILLMTNSVFLLGI